MQWSQVERVHAESLQGSFGRSAHAGFGVFVRVKIRHSAKLGGHEVIAASLLEEFTDERFATPHAVNVGGVEKGDTRIGGSVEDFKSKLVIKVAPVRAAKLPAAEADFRNWKICFAKRSCVHEPGTYSVCSRRPAYCVCLRSIIKSRILCGAGTPSMRSAASSVAEVE